MPSSSLGVCPWPLLLMLQKYLNQLLNQLLLIVQLQLLLLGVQNAKEQLLPFPVRLLMLDIILMLITKLKTAQMLVLNARLTPLQPSSPSALSVKLLMDLLNIQQLIQLFRDVYYAKTDLPLTMETLMLFRLLIKMEFVFQLLLMGNFFARLTTSGILYQLPPDNVLLRLLIVQLVIRTLLELSHHKTVINVLINTQLLLALLKMEIKFIMELKIVYSK